MRALEIIFEVQKKRSNGNTARTKKKLFNLQNAFFSSSFWTLPIFKASNLLIYCSFKKI